MGWLGCYLCLLLCLEFGLSYVLFDVMQFWFGLLDAGFWWVGGVWGCLPGGLFWVVLGGFLRGLLLCGVGIIGCFIFLGVLFGW